ncbi:MAG TPA: efflux RND transporter periplasmic adaptor subunit [Longimicrobium sp.]|nr:efflux RND transporter periplasmic adaptor subunit [Longimicrobium sp.]
MSDRSYGTARAAVGALAAVLALSACGKGQAADGGQPKQEDAGIVVGAENVLVVAAEPISSGPVLSGTLSAEREAQVRAEASGSVLQVFADRGQAVRAGQTLARIDDAALASASISAQSAVRTAEQALAVARRNAERAEALAGAGAIADRDMETARWNVTNAQGQLAAARAQLSNVQKQLSKTTVRAPISGVVNDRPVSAGDVVQPGAPMFTIIDPGSMRLEGSVPASELGALRVGAPVRFTVTGYPQGFTGTIRRISPSADPVTRQVPVYVSIPNTGGALVGGLFAQGRVEAEARQGITVPATAIDERGVQPSVLRLRGGKAERVNVAVGVRDPQTDRVEVTGGIAAGDTLLIGAALGTTPGTRVTVRAAGAAPAPAAR